MIYRFENGRFQSGALCTNGHPKTKPGHCRLCKSLKDKRYRTRKRAKQLNTQVVLALVRTPWRECI